MTFIHFHTQVWLKFLNTFGAIVYVLFWTFWIMWILSFWAGDDSTHSWMCMRKRAADGQTDLDERKDERIKFTTANIYLPDELSSSFSLSLYKQRLLACVLHMRIAVCEERVCLGALGYWSKPCMRRVCVCVNKWPTEMLTLLKYSPFVFYF